MKRDHIDLLVQLAFLEGSVTTHGLYEKTVSTRKPTVEVDPQPRTALIRRLEAALQRLTQSAQAPPTIGLFLRKARHAGSIQARDIYTRIGVTSAVYAMIERDRLTPIKIQAESWRRLQQLFQLPFHTLESMITHTYRLVFFRAAYGSTLARYDGRRSRRPKSEILKEAAEELYARASLPLPKQEQLKLENLLQAIREIQPHHREDRDE
jgi:hypothetical protein